MKILVATTLILALMTGACNSNASKTNAATATEAPSQREQATSVSTAQNPPMAEVMTAYLELKNALAKDDGQGAAAAGKKLQQALTSINKTSLSADQQKMAGDILDDAKENAEHIGANAGKIAHQREHFDILSRELYDLLKAGGSTGQKLYYDRCPMYNSGKGGFWISETKEIKNPFYGKSMSTCGSVKEELN